MCNFVTINEVKTKIKINKLFPGCMAAIPVSLLLRMLKEPAVHQVAGIKTVLCDVSQSAEFLPVYCMCVTVKSLR